jgi:DNA-binding transcriptional regulator GbsR (MarR family)
VLPHIRAFVEGTSALFEEDGVAPIAGLVFARLLLSPEPMALADLARELGVSKASVSTDTRRLEDSGILERVVRAGDRRVFYRIAPDFTGRLIERRLARMRRFRRLLQAAVHSPAAAAVRRRLRACDAAYGRMERVLAAEAEAQD